MNLTVTKNNSSSAANCVGLAHLAQANQAPLPSLTNPTQANQEPLLSMVDPAQANPANLSA